MFNILGPLTNPAMAAGRVLGVYEKRLIDIMACTLQKINVARAFVVCGDDGMDEFSVCALNHVAELRDNIIKKYVLDPADLGLKTYQPQELTGGSPKENAQIILDILGGKEKGAKKDAALLNAAVAIVAGKKAKNIKEGIGIARNAIETREALKKVEELIYFTNNIKHEG